MRSHAPTRLVAGDSARAEQLLPWNVDCRVRNAEVQPSWIDDPRFCYERQNREGTECVRVDTDAGLGNLEQTGYWVLQSCLCVWKVTGKAP